MTSFSPSNVWEQWELFERAGESGLLFKGATGIASPNVAARMTA